MKGIELAEIGKVVFLGSDGNIVTGKHGLLLVCSFKEEQRIKYFESCYVKK